MSEEEVKEAPKGASEDLLFEYLKDYRTDAYELFLNITKNLREIITGANASEEDKIDAAFLVGRIFEDVMVIMRLQNPKADNDMVEAIKALLKAYVALRKRPLYDVNEDLTEFSYELSTSVGEYISGLLTKWFKATEEAPDKAAAQGSSA